MDPLLTLLIETVAALIGMFVGMLAALAVERRREGQRNRQRAHIVLRALAHELAENHRTLLGVRAAYLTTPFGKSFYLSTSAWDTAVSSGDLPAIIGFELADSIATQYALLGRIRYYVDLLTRLWFAPADIPGYDEIRQSFIAVILDTMNRAINNHDSVLGLFPQTLR